MKRLAKVFINVMAVIMFAVMCFGLSGCGKDIKTVELKIQVYDYDKNEMYEESEVTMTIDLYRHLAYNTVDKLIEYINDGYYDDAVFYKISDFSDQFMLGDLKFDAESGKFYQNDIMPTIDGEFEYGGTTGSNLINEKGTLGLWRTWRAQDGHWETSTSTDTGRATWYIPTTGIADYNKWFCVFGKFNLEDVGTATAFNAIDKAFTSSGYYEEYEIYYTGEYDESKPNENYGLTFNCVPKTDFEEDDIDNLFVAEGAQFMCYNHYTIEVPLTGANGKIAAKIVSAKVK